MALQRSVVCPVLIGRSTQVEALNHLLANARKGAGRTLFIAGEAGIG